MLRVGILSKVSRLDFRSSGSNESKSAYGEAYDDTLESVRAADETRNDKRSCLLLEFVR